MTNEDARALLERVSQIRYAAETFTVSTNDIGRFASAIGATDRRYFDAATAAEHGLRDVVAPRGFYIGLGTARGRLIPRSAYSADGLPADESLDGARLVVGGSAISFNDDIYAGDTITVEQDVCDAGQRTGRSGPMVIVQLRRRYLREGEPTPLVTETITRILR